MSVLTLEEVEALAREAHAGQTDKAGIPYVEHLAAVAHGVRERGGDDEQIAAAWLHDAIEDDVLSRDWLATAPLTPHTKELVDAMTKREDEPLEAYAARLRATPGAVLIKAADVAHNADPARLARLDPETRERLSAKYARTRQLLGLPDTEDRSAAQS
ncbi:HD domain-containing protein [Streptomyces buecherae]|uniref:HD domain-containing protein n=1 Tax=Streptomyces buecherae TaxID=2763006 RepID=UPI00378D103E